jgi:hypothetical protein
MQSPNIWCGKKKKRQPDKRGKWKQKQKDPDRTLLVTRMDADKSLVIGLDENLGWQEILPL